jgi:cob(I)alamin adenosyltransferase
MKVYTKTGDKGSTSLYDGSRAKKSEFIFEVLGENDELSSRLGMSISQISSSMSEKTTKQQQESKKYCDQMRTIQSNIQTINTILATPSVIKRSLTQVNNNDIISLEKDIDDIEVNNSKLTKFILPGVTPSDACIHMCRTQCRKIERLLYKIQATGISETTKHPEGIDILINENIFKYMNRLSDYFFVLARRVCTLNGEEDWFV